MDPADELISAREYAKVLRELIKQENQLTNNRISWLLLLQGILFAAAANFMKIGVLPAVVIILLGIVTSISFFHALRFSSKARKSFRKMWRDRISSNEELKRNVPPVDGVTSTRCSFLFPWRFVPWAVVVAWVVLLMFLLLVGVDVENPT